MVQILCKLLKNLIVIKNTFRVGGRSIAGYQRFLTKRLQEQLIEITAHLLTCIELWYFECRPSPDRLVWAAGRPGLPLLLWALLRMFSQPFAEVHWRRCEELGGWRRRLAGSRQFKSKHTGKDSHTHTYKHTQYPFFICSCFTHTVCQEYKFK